MDRSSSGRRATLAGCTCLLGLVFGGLALLTGHASTVEPSRIDTIYINARIYEPALTDPQIKACSGKTGSAAGDCLEAIAVTGDTITAIGPTKEILSRYQSKDSQVIDLGAHFVMAGFNDAHVHLASAGREKLTIDLVGVGSLSEMQQRIATAAKAAPAGAWLRGRGWDHLLWTGKILPTRKDLDAVTGDHPAIFTRVDGHIALANSKALQLAGIAANSPDPPAGKIDRDEKGVPTGIVRETAVDLVYDKAPAPSHSDRRRALELATRDAAAHGITSAQDYSTWDDFLVFEEMEREHALPIRISEWLTFLDPLPTLKSERSHHSSSDPMLHTGMLKGFMDGSLGSRTAALEAPYSDDPGNSGIPQFDQAKLDRMTIERAQAGFQIGFHAIGDRGVKMALDAFAAAEKVVPEARTYRFRIEHIQIINPDDFAHFKSLGVIASMQPNHLLTDMYWAQDRVGSARARNSYTWKTFEDQGTVLAFGTDYPVEPVTPFRGLYAAVTRKSEDGTRIYHPEQALSIERALYDYTEAAAFAEHTETKKGLLVPGQLADFVVLDRDLLHIAPAEILKTQVLRTVVGGKTVFTQGAEHAP